MLFVDTGVKDNYGNDDEEEVKDVARGVHSLLYFAYTCVWDLFSGGVIYLAQKTIR
jgi:hypothetical protein